MEIRSRRRADGYVLGSGGLLVIPSGQPHDIKARSSVFDAVALYPAAVLLERVAREDGISLSALERFTSTVVKLRRSPWLEGIAEKRYA